MAVAFDAKGPSAGTAASGSTSPLTWTHTGTVGAAVVVFAVIDNLSQSTANPACTYGGAPMNRLAMFDAGGSGSNTGFLVLFGLANVAGGAQTVSLSWSGTSDIVAGGSVSYTGAASTTAAAFGTPSSNGATGTSGSVTISTTSSQSQVAAGDASGFSAAPTMSAGTLRVSGGGSSAGSCGEMGCGDSPGTGGNVTLTFAQGGSATYAVIGVEVLPGTPVTPTGPPVPLFPPGWFPGADRVAAEPGAVPFAPLPGTTDAAPALIIPPTPEAAPFQAPALAPGWFPGADRVTTEPGGIPFLQLPPPADPSQAILPPPAPDGAGIPDFLPLPPGYFPGSQTVTVDPGGIPFYAQPVPLLPALPPAAPPVITGVAGTGAASYWADQYGNPRLFLGDAVWNWPGNAGRYTNTWQQDFDTLVATRASQGHTVLYCKPVGTLQSGGLDNFGKTFDGLFPFQGGTPSTGVSGANPSSGLTSAFWARIDYMLSSAAVKGITIMLNAVGYHSDVDGTVGATWESSWVAADFQTYGSLLGGRYANRANLIWMVEDDYVDDAGINPKMDSFLSGLRNAGDTHLIAMEYESESTGRKFLDGTTLTWGTSNAQFAFCYSYNEAYFAVEQAYAETSPLCVTKLDGYFYQGASTYTGGTGTGAFDRLYRQAAWWALAAGSRGYMGGDEAVWQFASTALTSASTNWWYANNALNIYSAVTSLTGWHQLQPDTGSGFITAGRGTRTTYGSSWTVGTSGPQHTTGTYVACSKTPNTGSGSSLVLFYLPNATTITIDDTQVAGAPGYTATWIDPVSGATSTAAPGGTSGARTFNSTAKGTNSQGDPDWVLVLQGTATAAATPQPVVVPQAAVVQAANW